MLPKEIPTLLGSLNNYNTRQSLQCFAEHAVGEDGIETEKLPPGKWYSDGLSEESANVC